MAVIFPRWTNLIPLGLAAVAPVAALGAVVTVWYWFSPEFTDVGYRPIQPVPYSHALHVGSLGMDCRYCHTTVDKAAHAAIPPTETCMNCHAIVQAESPRLATVRESWETGLPVPWKKVHLLPEYAHFNHAVHVSAGVGCETCHGRVDQMRVVEQVEPLSMGWCLDCHRDPEPFLRPVEEVTTMGWDAAAAAYDPRTDPARVRDVEPPLHCSGCHY